MSEPAAIEEPSGAPQSSGRKLFGPWLWIPLLAAVLAVPLTQLVVGRIAPQDDARRADPKDTLPEVMAALPQWQLVDEHGKPFGQAQLQGKVYVTNFFFTSCVTVCPKLMSRMALLRDRLVAAGEPVELVSITVDPETDTPEKLLSYGATYGAKGERWHLVTGDFERVHEAIEQGFRFPMGNRPGAGKDAHILHGSRLILVDADGQMRGVYPTDDESLAILQAHASKLQKLAGSSATTP